VFADWASFNYHLLYRAYSNQSWWSASCWHPIWWASKFIYTIFKTEDCPFQTQDSKAGQHLSVPHPAKAQYPCKWALWLCIMYDGCAIQPCTLLTPLFCLHWIMNFFWSAGDMSPSVISPIKIITPPRSKTPSRVNTSVSHTPPRPSTPASELYSYVMYAGCEIQPCTLLTPFSVPM